MPYYNLLVVAENRMLATAAASRDAAIAHFGDQLGKRLTLTPLDDPTPAPYLLDEWFEVPHWVNPTIPVFEISG